MSNPIESIELMEPIEPKDRHNLFYLPFHSQPNRLTIYDIMIASVSPELDYKSKSN